MARNFKELQANMEPASRADKVRRVCDELRRTSLEGLKDGKQLTESDRAILRQTGIEEPQNDT